MFCEAGPAPTQSPIYSTLPSVSTFQSRSCPIWMAHQISNCGSAFADPRPCPCYVFQIVLSAIYLPQSAVALPLETPTALSLLRCGQFWSMFLFSIVLSFCHSMGTPPVWSDLATWSFLPPSLVPGLPLLGHPLPRSADPLYVPLP